MGDFWSGTTANTAGDATSTLTAESMLAMMRDFQQRFPPPPKFDLYGSHAIDTAYELDLAKTMPEMIPRSARGRRFLVVPKDELDKWYHTLLDAGCDVRLEPRWQEPWPILIETQERT